MSSAVPVPSGAHFVVESFDATPIHYDFYDAPSRSAVLIVPGFWRDRRHPAMVRMARFLVDEGYRAAMCDLRGHGDSGGRFGFNLHEHYDVAAVADDILCRTSVERLTVVGFSYGGAISVSTAARHPELPIASLLLISPVADFSMIAPRINLMHRHVAFAQAFRRPRIEWGFARSTKLRALDDVADVHVPISLIHVKNDWLVDHGHSVALFERANEPKELHIIDIPGNYHADRIFSVASETVEPLVKDFLHRFTG
ncbi:MAG TPA: alpha/beta fold hydrolase [Thermoanaerobaculia bacterium]|nr:alpha/beta fold hydrolase [Thermoanaerobaculia bacterium]